MGGRYLWVDCLSIVQDSPEKHRNIDNMDIVFSRAELTIVAVYGTDANSGLAGAQQGTRRRRAMPRIQGHHIIALALPIHKYSLLYGATYTRRGWTFQELLLSKRLLFVTEYQLVLHCTTSWCSESLPKGEHHKGTMFSEGIVDLQPRAAPLRSSNAIIESYITMVREYNTRRLSFQTDIVNGFSGLASILEEWCEGCPVIDGMLSRFFGLSMMWNFGAIQDLSCAYSMTERGKRRKGFPSWAWVG
jgi:hypothetical protein